MHARSHVCIIHTFCCPHDNIQLQEIMLMQWCILLHQGVNIKSHIALQNIFTIVKGSKATSERISLNDRDDRGNKLIANK